MIELPEALTLARQANQALAGKTVARVLKPTKAGRFCFYNGDPALYDDRLRAAAITSAEGFGIFMEMGFSTGEYLCVNDGVRLTYEARAASKGDYQLRIEFTDGSAITFTIAMYGGIYLHDGSFDNPYYIRNKTAPGVFAPDFGEYFDEAIKSVKPSMSAKAFVATEQRFAGLGNGCCQDVLFNAGLSPRHKVADMSPAQRDALKKSIPATLKNIADRGGRDTEKDLFGNPGGYETLMSRNRASCPRCGKAIKRETYLGGSVYYCENCQR